MQKILKKLVSFKTISNDREENNKILNWIREEIKDLPLFIKEIDSKGVKSLVVTTQKTKKPKLFLMAHTDVVSGSSEIFKTKIIGDKMYGRGVYDMKFAIACYLKLLKEMGKNLGNYNFGIILTTDEEIGGFNGTKAVIGKGYNADVCFLPDGGEDWKIENQAKGVWHLMIESKGVSVHGSRPWLGDNAIEKLTSFLIELKKHFPIKESKNYYCRTLNVGKIEGGTAINKVPDYAKAYIDIRFLSENEKQEIKTILGSTKNKFKGIKIISLIHGESFFISQNDKYVEIAEKIIMKEVGEKAGFSFSHGSSDARFFKKTPVILVRPRGGGAHSEKEWIDLKDLNKFYLFIKSFVEKVALK